MNRTINGKSPADVLKELSVPFEFVREKETNYYVPSCMIQERLDEVLGLNWSFEPTSKPELTELDQKHYFLCDGQISIFDDEGNLFARRSQSGGVEVIIIKGSGKVKNLVDSKKAAVSSCFKKCAEMFGVGRNIALDTNNDKLVKYPVKNSRKNNMNNNHSASGQPGTPDEKKDTKGSSNPKGNENTMSFTVTDKVKITKTFTKVPVKDHVSGKEAVLVFWASFLKDRPEIKERLSKIEIGEELKVDTTKIKFDENVYGNELQFTAKAA